MKKNIENQNRILIKDLLVRCIIGVNEFERREKQDVVINIELWSDFTKAAKTDNIRDTVNYREINKSVIGLAEKSEFFLIETLADKIAHLCLQHNGIQKVKVTVEKPGALRFAKSVGVEIIREKD